MTRVRSIVTVQIDTGLAEQRIGEVVEGADHWPDATPLHQPAPRPRLPHGAGSLEDVLEFLRAADGDLPAKFGELAGADIRRQVAFNHLQAPALPRVARQMPRRKGDYGEHHHHQNGCDGHLH